MSILSRNIAACSIAAFAMLVPLAARADQPLAELPPLPSPVTSFGAAAVNGSLYVYGGHLGSPHKYSADMQAKDLLRLNLAQPQKWETVAEGPRRTGLALVAHKGKLYRVGGWEAKNARGDDWDLYSTRDFARFDPKTGQWENLVPLPRGRSSHDAAVLGDHLYVVGGWELSGEGDGDWHETAYVCDLSAEKPEWKEIARPGFCRRALAVAAYEGKLYVIGGMNDSGEMTTEVSVYEPRSNTWASAPSIPGEATGGFGVSAIGTEAGLFASPRTGEVYRLEGNSWNQVGKLEHPRFFHRLVDGGAGRLIAVGGTARSGKVAAVESISVVAESGE